MKKISFFFFLLLGVSFSCSMPDPQETVNAEYFNSPLPVTTGIWLIDEKGNSYGAWGTPSSPLTVEPQEDTTSHGNPTDTNVTFIEDILRFEDFTLYLPTPNPTKGPQSFVFVLPNTTFVKIWVEKAQFVGKIENTSSAGAIIAGSSTTTGRKIAEGFYHGGAYKFIWDGKDNDGKRLPTGFYRVYVATSKKILFHDIYLAESDGELLPGMKR